MQNIQLPFHFQILEGENFPVKICSKCCNRIEEWSAFKIHVEKNQKYIYKTLKTNVKQELLEPEEEVISTQAGSNSIILSANSQSEEHDNELSNFYNGMESHEATTTGDDPQLVNGVIEFIVPDDDVDHFYSYDSELTEDPIEDPFADESDSIPTLSETNGEENFRRQSMRSKSKPEKYFLTKQEEIQYREFVKTQKEYLKSSTLAERAGPKLRIEDVEMEEMSVVKSPPEKRNRHKIERPLATKVKISGHKASVLKKMQLKREQEKEKLSWDEFQFRYDQWSTKTDDFILRFIPIINCKLCEEKFSSFNKLRAHANTAHPDANDWFTCCGRNYLCRRDLFNHLNFHVNPNKNACQTCLMVFGSAQKYNHHVVEFHTDAFKCGSCPIAFGSEFQLSKHFLSHLPFKVSCPQCPDKVIPTVKDLNRHFAFYHPHKHLFYECHICPHKLGTLLLKLTHELIAHGYHAKSLACVCCGKKKAINFLWKHYQINMKSLYGSLDCPDCELSFKSFKLLRVHHVNLHSLNAFKN